MMENRMEKHVNLVAALNIGFGSLLVLIAAVTFVIIAGGGLIGGLSSGESLPITITAIVGTAIAAFLVLLGAPSIVGGIGLLKRKAWARILLLVGGFLNLLDFPLGTALGIYTIWVLMNDEVQSLFVTGSGQ